MVALYNNCEAINTSKTEFVEWAKQSGITCGLSTIRGWAANIREQTLRPQETEITRRERLLSELQIKIMIGWVLHQNGERVAVTNFSLLAQIRDFFDIDISVSTAAAYLKENGISHHRLIRAGPDVVYSFDDVCSAHLQFLREMQDQGLRERSNNELLSVDYHYNSHRSEQRSGFRREGRCRLHRSGQ